jgi:hypothetical protein
VHQRAIDLPSGTYGKGHSVKIWRWARWVLAAACLPFAVLGLLVLAVEALDPFRYDSAYFGEPYLERYSTPAAAVKAMERALRRGEPALLAELQGLRWPAKFQTSPGMAFVELWERNGRYSVYLFLDRQTYQRYLIPFEQVQGRWVAAPLDLHYYVHSGKWHSFFLAVAAGWWLVCAIGWGLLWLGRRSARFRI